MIKKIILAALTSIVLLPSCKKSDNGPRKNTLVGSWLTVRAAIDNNGNGVPDANEAISVDTSAMAVYKFNANATITINNYSNPSSGSFNGNWTLEDNDEDIKVVQTDQGSAGTSIRYHIVSLADQDLTLSFKDLLDSAQTDFLMFKRQ